MTARQKITTIINPTQTQHNPSNAAHTPKPNHNHSRQITSKSFITRDSYSEPQSSITTLGNCEASYLLN